MARPLRITYPGAFYHVTCRGNERKDIFKSKRDREKLIEYFESADTASLKDIFAEVESAFGTQVFLSRNIKMFLCQRYTGEKLKDIGTYFGIGESGVSQACRRWGLTSKKKNSP